MDSHSNWLNFPGAGHLIHHLTSTLRQEIRRDATELLSKSNNLQQSAVELRRAVKEQIANDDFLKQVKVVAQGINQHDQAVRNWQAEIVKLSKHFEAHSPSEDEIRLLDLIQNDELNDIVTLKSQYQSDDESFWEALRGLYVKNYLQIRIQRVDEL